MPFKSKAQEGYLRANHPDVAEKFAAHTTKKQRANMPYKINKRANDTKRRNGAAMAGSGAVLTGTGLVAGGIPFTKEPKAMEIFNVRGRPRGHVPSGDSDPRARKSRIHPANLGHNAKKVVPLPRTGILGFRSNIHDFYIRENQDKKKGNAYVQGMRSGKLEAEKQIVSGMRAARRATYPVTIGGAALTAAGLNRMRKDPVKKRETRERGAAAGTAGAAAGVAAGARVGAEADRPVMRYMRAKMMREWEKTNGRRSPARDFDVKGWNMSMSGATPGKDPNFVRNSRVMSRSVKGGALIGAGALGTAGYLAARGKKVEKRDTKRRDASAAALGGGATLAGVGHYVPKGLDRYGRKYANSSIQHTLAARNLAPHFGGVKEIPAKIGEYGEVKRPSRLSMNPELTDAQLREPKRRAVERIKGGAKVREQVGRHRGLAAQERHFAEVFNATSRGVRRVRGPGLALAGAGATGLWASQDAKKSRVRKSQTQYGYQQTRLSKPRAVEAAAGLALIGYGGSRNGLVMRTLARGARTPGSNQINFKRAEKLRAAIEDTTGRGADMLKQRLGTGYKLRNSEAIIGGGLLVNHAIPVRRKQFTPIQQGGF